MTRYIVIILVLTFLGLISCREEFLPELDQYENKMVVDGTISNAPGPYTIKLSLSSSLENLTYEEVPLSGYLVEIMDDAGNSEVLNEIEEGEYVTSESGIQGVIGRSYKLLIQTPHEEVFESEFQKILEPVGIGSVYAILESQQTTDPDFPQWGYQFYLDTEEKKNDTLQLLWRTYGTYEFHSDYLIRYIYDGSLKEFYNSDSLFYCWKNHQINRNLTASTINLSTPVIKGFKLNYITTETRALSVRYSFLVRQFRLNMDAYNYYSSVQNITDEQSTLYASLPYQVKGNVRNMNDPDKAALGYFLVSSEVSKRIFVDRPTGNIHNYGICVLSDRDYEAMRWIWATGKAEWPLYVTTDDNYRRALPTQECIDCTKKGGETIKPDFWVD